MVSLSSSKGRDNGKDSVTRRRRTGITPEAESDNGVTTPPTQVALHENINSRNIVMQDDIVSDISVTASTLSNNNVAGVIADEPEPLAVPPVYGHKSVEPMMDIDGFNNSNLESKLNGAGILESDNESECPSNYLSRNPEEDNENDSKNELTNSEPRRIFPTHIASHNSKYKRYHLLVDHEQDDKAVEIALCSMSRPHMRGFHFAWFSFFIAFLCWFAVAPLLSEVQKSLDLSKDDLWISNVLSVTGSAILRIIVGPLCDKYGARMCTVTILFVSAIPTIMLGLAKDAVTLGILRFFIGMGGATFVTCQYWTSSMFTREVAGTANALVAGWGNLGGGVTLILVGSILFPFFKWAYGEVDIDSEDQYDGAKAEDQAWRTVCIIPGMLCLIFAFSVMKFADDSPKGNYSNRKKLGFMSDVNIMSAFHATTNNFNTWILFLQYGCCFGVEVTVSNTAALYFQNEFGLSTELAAAIASVFGWMNLFARGLGGFMSDMCNAWNGMRGRLAWLTTCLLLEGLSILLFAYSKSLTSSVLAMALFSLFVQATEGCVFGIVPYINPHVTGSTVGIVGAGGNFGGIFFSSIFLFTKTERDAFALMGWFVVASSLLSAFVRIRGHAGLICGNDSPDVRSPIKYRKGVDQEEEVEESEYNSVREFPNRVHFCGISHNISDNNLGDLCLPMEYVDVKDYENDDSRSKSMEAGFVSVSNGKIPTKTLPNDKSCINNMGCVKSRDRVDHHDNSELDDESTESTHCVGITYDYPDEKI